MKPKPATIQIDTFVIKRGDYVLGTTPDERWAKAIAGVNEREQPGVTIEYSSLEAAELKIREQRRQQQTVTL